MITMSIKYTIPRAAKKSQKLHNTEVGIERVQTGSCPRGVSILLAAAKKSLLTS
jgi:hypothetical protein